MYCVFEKHITEQIERNCIMSLKLNIKYGPRALAPIALKNNAKFNVPALSKITGHVDAETAENIRNHLFSVVDRFAIDSICDFDAERNIILAYGKTMTSCYNEDESSYVAVAQSEFDLFIESLKCISCIIAEIIMGRKTYMNREERDARIAAILDVARYTDIPYSFFRGDSMMDASHCFANIFVAGALNSNIDEECLKFVEKIYGDVTVLFPVFDKRMTFSDFSEGLIDFLVRLHGYRKCERISSFNSLVLTMMPSDLNCFGICVEDGTLKLNRDKDICGNEDQNNLV